MADLATFERELDASLQRKTVYVSEKVLPAIPAHVRTLRSGVETVYNVLMKKGLLREDPYKYEEKISDLDVPADTPFSESERDRELSIRLSAYQSRLEYLAQYYDFSLEALDLKELKQLSRFIRFINWRNLTENSTASTTRGIAEQILKVSKSGDPLSANLIEDAREQLSKAMGSLTDLIREVLTLRREEYKFEVRSRVIGPGGIPADPDEAAVDDAARRVKAALPKRAPGLPFARELVLEIFAENRGKPGQELRDELLRRLRVPDESPVNQGPVIDLKGVLLEGARALAMAGRPLEELAKLLADNAAILDSRKLTFSEMLRKIWDRMRGRDTEARIFPIELVDDETGVKRSEDIDLNAMLSAMKKRSRLYGGILARTSAWTRLTEASADSILKFVTRDSAELMQTIRRAEALETFIKSEVAREQRSQLRSCGEQAAAIRDAARKGRQKAQAFVTKSQEMEQLRKLGIRS